MEASEDKTTSGPKLRGISAEADVGEPLLPDEVLMLIFSKVTDGLTLLDSLPLVCKQWCRVARDPSSWAGVELWFNKTLLGEEARVLLHAPALSKLAIDEPTSASMPLDCDTEAEAAVAKKILSEIRRRMKVALLRSRAVVHDLVVGVTERSSSGSDPYFDLAFACFLSRQRELRELWLYVAATSRVRSSVPWIRQLDTEAKTLQAVAALRSLEKLHITVREGARKGWYRGEFGGGSLPKLRELRLYSFANECSISTRPPELPAGLIGDLVRGKSALRVLSVDMPLFAPDREACLALRGLEELTIDVSLEEKHGSRVLPFGEGTTRVLRAAGELCLQMATTSLKTVTISLCRGVHMTFSDKRRERCRQVVREFARRLPHAEVQLAMKSRDCGFICDVITCECDSFCDCTVEDTYPHTSSRICFGGDFVFE